MFLKRPHNKQMRSSYFFHLLVAVTVVAASERQSAASEQVALRAAGMDAQQTFTEPDVVALVKAIEREDLPGIDQALNRGANINAIGERRQTPLHWSLLKVGISVATVKHLLDRGANPNAPMDYGNTPLLLTAGGNRPDLLELFLANGGNPNVSTRSGSTPLMNAIASQFEANFRLLLKYGADPNLGETCGSTVANARFDFTIELLKMGLTKNLSFCKRLIEMRVIRSESPQHSNAKRAIEMLNELIATPSEVER